MTDKQDLTEKKNITSSEVFSEELFTILYNRRQKTGEPLPDESEKCNDLIGLALSGGGIRSGAFNLGVIQTMDEQGMLSWIDYMSSVSGGGYAAAYVSSSTVRNGFPNKGNVDHRRLSDGQYTSKSAQPASTLDDPAKDIVEKSQSCHKKNTVNDSSSVKGGSYNRCDTLPITDAEEPKHSKRLRRFIFSGNYLNRTLVFFNNYIIGLVLVLSVAVSAIVFLTSSVAWAYSLLKGSGQYLNWIKALGFRTDLGTIFFPTVALFLPWFFIWLIYWYRPTVATSALVRIFFLGMMLCIFVGFAVFLGTGDVDITSLITTHQLPELATEATNTVARGLYTTIAIVTGIGLVPFLLPRKLLKSGTNPENAHEKVFYWLATRTMVCLVPFLLIMLFSRENISNYNNTRDDILYRSNIIDWSRSQPAYSPLWVQLEKERREQRKYKQSSVFLKLLYPHRPPPGGPLATFFEKEKIAENLSSIARENALNLKYDSEVNFLIRPWLVISYALKRIVYTEGDSNSRDHVNPVKQYVNSQEKIIRIKDIIVAKLNSLMIMEGYPIAPGRNGSNFEYELINKSGYALEGSSFYKRFHKYVEHERLKDPGSIKVKSYDAVHEYIMQIDEGKRIAGNNSFLNSPKNGKVSQNLNIAQGKKLLKLNRELLEAWYPDGIGNRDNIYSLVVLKADQEFRLKVIAWSLGIFLLSSCLVSLNATSWHRFYKEQLSAMWFANESGNHDPALIHLDSRPIIQPYHLISGTVHWLGRIETTDLKLESFLFSRKYCGCDSTGYLETRLFHGGDLTLGDAVAISGSAVSPTQTQNPLIMSFLLLANIRLGQWVQNPNYQSLLPNWLDRFFISDYYITPARVLLNLFRTAEKRPFCFVTDGGHHENLGIEPLLERRCKLIIASDAGQDAEYRFSDLSRLIRWARIQHGIMIQPVDIRKVSDCQVLHDVKFDTDGTLLDKDHQEALNLQMLIPGMLQDNAEESRFSDTHCILAKIQYPQERDEDCAYPDQGRGYLLYLKASLTGDEPFDLLQYARSHSQFPHDSTSDQFFGPDQFESYRQLGQHIARTIFSTGDSPGSHPSSVHFGSPTQGDGPKPGSAAEQFITKFLNAVIQAGHLNQEHVEDLKKAALKPMNVKLVEDFPLTEDPTAEDTSGVSSDLNQSQETADNLANENETEKKISRLINQIRHSNTMREAKGCIQELTDLLPHPKSVRALLECVVNPNERISLLAGDVLKPAGHTVLRAIAEKLNNFVSPDSKSSFPNYKFTRLITMYEMISESIDVGEIESDDILPLVSVLTQLKSDHKKRGIRIACAEAIAIAHTKSKSQAVLTETLRVEVLQTETDEEVIKILNKCLECSLPTTEP